MDNSSASYTGNNFKSQNQTTSHEDPFFDREHCPVTSNTLSVSNQFEKAESIIASMPNRPQVYPHTEGSFGYTPDYDRVTIPYIELYSDKEEYYKGVFHELIHATGHPIRLYRRSLDCGLHNRHAHAMEELTAELGATILCREAAIGNHTLDDSLSYIVHWSKYFENPYQMVFRTAQKAWQAADYVLNRTPGKPF